jgi:hypothetical protein
VLAVTATALAIGPFACSLEGLTGGGPDGGAPDGASSAVPTSTSTTSGTIDAGCPGCVPIVDGESNPTELVEDNGRLVWIRKNTTGQIASSDLDGSHVIVEEKKDIADGHDLSVTSDAQVFALSSDGVVSRYLDYSSCTGADGIQRLAVYGGVELLRVRGASLTLGDCGSETTLVTESAAITVVLSDPPYVWYAVADGTIVRCDATSTSKCASSRSVLATGQASVDTMTQDGSRVIWATGDAQAEIHARAKSAAGTPGDPVVLARATRPRTLATSGADLYWTDPTDGTIRHVGTDGQAHVIASGLNQPWGLVLTSSAMYVSEYANPGRILRMPR